MLEQSQFPFSSEPYFVSESNNKISQSKSYVFPLIVLVVVVTIFASNLYYNNYSNDGFKKDDNG